MKTVTALLALVLCAMLLLPCAAAEDAVYVPGETMNALVSQAWEDGRLITGDVKLALDLDGDALGFTAEDEALMEAIQSVLDAATLSVSTVRLEDGVRFSLEAVLPGEDGACAAADAALTLSRDGIAVESSLLPGQRVTARWETLLAMAGVSDSDIVMLLSLRDMDLEELIASATTMIAPMLEQAGTLMAPYGEIVTAWLNTLAADQQTDVAGDEYLPAAALVTNLFITDRDLGSLIVQLATQLEQDATLCALIDAALAQIAQGDADIPSAAELCAELRQSAALINEEENPFVLTVGVDADGAPLYGELYKRMPDGSSLYASLAAYPAEEAGFTHYDCSLFMMDESNTLETAFSISGDAGADPADPLSSALTANLLLAANEAQIGLSYAIDASSDPAEDGLPGVTVQQTMTMNFSDGYDSVQMVMDGLTTCAATAENGERSDSTVTLDMYMGQESLSLITVSGMMIAPAAEGFTGSFGIVEAMPEAGINSMGYSVSFSTGAYDPAQSAALTEFALDTATSEDIAALESALSTSLEQLIGDLSAVLPPALAAELTGE